MVMKTLILDDGRRFQIDPEKKGLASTAKVDVMLICEGGERVYVTRYQLCQIGIEPALRGTEECLKSSRKNTFFGLFIVGKPGSGKSSYAIRMLSEVYGSCGYDSHVFRVESDSGEFRELPMLIVWEHNWAAWKTWLIFTPDQFVDKLDETQATGKQERMLAWDDAGVWLSKYNWASEFSQGVSDQFEVIRRSFASVVFTCPNSKKLLKSIRDFPAMAKGKPSEMRGGDDEVRRIRVYEKEIDLSSDKEYSNKLFEEIFNVMLPDDVFKEYDPISRMYGKIVTVFLKTSLKALKDKGATKYAEAVNEMVAMIKQ